MRILSWSGERHDIKRGSSCLTLVRAILRPVSPGVVNISKRGNSHEDNQLDGISKRDIHQGPQGIAHVTGNGLGRVGQQSRQRDHSSAVEAKDDAAVYAVNLRRRYAGRDEYQEHVDGAEGQGVVDGSNGRLEERPLWGRRRTSAGHRWDEAASICRGTTVMS